MKIYSRLLVMLMLLTAVFLVACGGEEEPTPVPPTEVPPTAVPTEVPPTEVPPTEVPPTEVPPTEVPPTATPEPEPDVAMTTHESVDGGYTVEYPEEWFANEIFGMGLFSSNEVSLEDMGDMNDLDGGVVIIMGGAMAEVEGEDPMDMLDQASGEFDMSEDDMEILEGPTAVTINGNDAALLTVKGDADGTEIYATIAVLTNGINDVVVMAIAPAADEDTYASIFDAMLNSIEISEEELPNPFGDIGEVEVPEMDAINTGTLAFGTEVAGLVIEDTAMSWTFEGTADSALNLVVTPLADELDVIVDVVDADGMSILPFGEIDDAFGEEIVAFDVPADGTYLVILHGFAGSGGAYNLILTEDGAAAVPAAGDGAVLYTETVSGIVPVDETITHEFEGVAGGVINVVVTPTDDDLDAVVDIWDADGNSIIGGEVDEEFDVETLTGIVLPADGTYQVAIRGFAGGGGAYDLTYTEIDGSGAAPMPTGEGGGAIGYGDLVTGDVTSDDGNMWTFIGAEGDFVDVTVEPADDFDVIVDVVDSAGNSMLPDGAADSSFDTEFVRVVPISANGQYAIIVTPYADGEVGTYDLVLNETLLEGAGSILFVSNEFTDPEEEGFTYPFTADAGEYVTLYVVPESLELDVVLGVYYAETDELIEEIDNSTGREELIFYAEELDNYYFLVTSFEGSIGGFDLALSGSENVIYEITVGDGLVGRFINGEMLTYGYYGEAGTTVTFIIESDDNMDMVITLEDMDANILIEMDDEVSGDGELLTYTFEESLYIFVNVTEFYGDTGQFALYVE